MVLRNPEPPVEMQPDGWVGVHGLRRRPKGVLSRWWFAPLLVLIHIPLALVMRSQPAVGVAIAVGAIAAGSISAARGRLDNQFAIYAAAYVTGSEVLWRTVGVAGLLSWEMGKYGVAAIAIVALIRRPGGKVPQEPIVYALLLFPSILLWLGQSNQIDLAWRRINGSLAGPVVMVLCAVWFSRATLDRSRLRGIALAIVAPAAGIGTLSIFNIVTLGEQIHFGRTASREAAGGGGPNQVANALALAALLCWLLMAQGGLRARERILVAATMTALLIPMIFTLSRGGVFTLGLAIVATSPFILRGRRQRLSFLSVAAVFSVLVIQVIWPAVDRYTAGAVEERYSTIQSSRWDLARGELETWMDHPVLGVGPGLARGSESVVRQVGRELQAHLEFTRLLAEHGVFGLVALVFFVLGFVRCFRAARAAEWRVWVVGAMVFVCAYWMQSATRTVAPSYMYGLMWAGYIPLLYGGPTSHGGRKATR